MLKRVFDICMATFGLLITSPILLPLLVLIWRQDYHSPFYIAPRVGKRGKIFKMVKLRSMVVNADKTGVDSTSANDTRITPLGQFIRAYKLDELPQLWNVFKGDMSLVGPRPNVQRDTDLYTQVERDLLSVRPGITDLASIVFSDEGEILKDSQNPDLDYNQLIRPWKSRLGLLYVENSSFTLDVKLIYLTIVAIFSRENALNGVQRILADLEADETLKRVASRQEELSPYPPPGANQIVEDRKTSAPPYPPRRAHNRYFLLADLFLLPIAVVISFALRLDQAGMVEHAQLVLLYAGLAAFIKPFIFYFLGLYRRHWRYAGVNDLLSIVIATFFASTVIMVIMTSLITLFIPLSRSIPRSIPFLDWLVSTALIGAARFTVRLNWERPFYEFTQNLRGKRSEVRRKRVLVAGAGDAGVMVAREMASNPSLGLDPVGFVDDNSSKMGLVLRSLPVLGTPIDLPRIVQAHQIDEVLIAMPTAPGKAIRRIVDLCQAADVEYKTIPSIYDLISGEVSIDYLRDIQIDDLLRREPIEVDELGISSYLEGKCVLITGAGGSIGSELARQVARYNPALLILLGHGENSIHTITQELQRAFLDLEVRACIADIRDTARIHDIFKQCQPHAVFHAAAHKHVPLMEQNVIEAITNNIFGTQVLLDAAQTTQVERFVFISSDKAVNPTSIMGATKRMAELMVQEVAERIPFNFVSVRFGNVLGSRGSVVPLFQQQIAQGGPITITHPDMERFFMTIPEAVHLVIQAGALGQGGETFVLDMGQPIKIVDLARDMVELSGLKLGEDIDIVFTGLRPGEKLSERLFSPYETIQITAHPKISAITSGNSSQRSLSSLQDALESLKPAVQRQDETEACYILRSFLPNVDLQVTPSSSAKMIGDVK